MMGIARELSITYGGFSLGAAPYQLHGPYEITRSFDASSVSFTVVVTGTSDSAFQSAIDAIETALRKRDQALTITKGGEDWGSFVFGATGLNPTCELTKVGDQQTDTGRSRTYSATFSCENPADDQQGLFTVNTAVTYLASRQRQVSISGEYRALGGVLASTQYQNRISAEEQQILDFLDSGAPWELIDENMGYDRNNHVASFSREFVELLYEQPEGWDDGKVVGHRVIFNRVSSYPGDGDPNTNRPEIIAIEYGSSVDKDHLQGDVDLNDLYENTIYPWLIDKFTGIYNPQAFAVTQHMRQINPTSNEISSKITITAYMEGGDVVQYETSTEYVDDRTIDYTPVWNDHELAAYADQGFMVRTRVTTVHETKLGEHAAEHPLTPNAVNASGWNQIRGAATESPVYMGEGDERVRLTVLSTAIVERYTVAPSDYGQTVPAGPPQFKPGGRTEEEIQAALLRQKGPYTGGGSVTGSA